MKEYLLSFEMDQDKDQVFIHGDPKGLRQFATLLEKLADIAEAGEFPHEHLFTENWGGNGLTSDPQEKGHFCLNHVKVYGWPDAQGSKPYMDMN